MPFGRQRLLQWTADGINASLSLYRNQSFPLGMVIAFHLFSAVRVLAVWLSYRENVKEKRALLGLDEPG